MAWECVRAAITRSSYSQKQQSLLIFFQKSQQGRFSRIFAQLPDLGSLSYFLKYILKTYQECLKIRQVYNFFFLISLLLSLIHFVFSTNPPTNLEKKKNIYILNTLGAQHKLTASGGERTRGNIWLLFLKK